MDAWKDRVVKGGKRGRKMSRREELKWVTGEGGKVKRGREGGREGGRVRREEEGLEYVGGLEYGWRESEKREGDVHPLPV